MSVHRHTCYTITCDACRSGLEDDDSGYTPHYETADAALVDAVEHGWHLDTDGALFCTRCVDIATCLTESHDYGPWTPCHCQGLIPDHALWGCGLFRTCRRNGCGHTDHTDLAHLPTTDEPATFGR